jgi:hypothetical protein
MGFDKSSVETEPEGAIVRRMADAAIAQHGYRAAEEKVVAGINSQARLITWAIHRAARAEIRLAMAARRVDITGVVDDRLLTSQPAKPYTKQKEQAYSEEVCRKVSEWAGKYLAWPMSDKRLLGEATLQDVRREAEMYEANAQGNARNGRFMRLLEKRLQTLKIKTGETVGQVLTDDQLATLMAKATKAE